VYIAVMRVVKVVKVVMVVLLGFICRNDFRCPCRIANCHDIGRDAHQVLPRRQAVAMVTLGQFRAILHDASCFTVEDDAVFRHGYLINGG